MNKMLINISDQIVMVKIALYFVIANDCIKY